LINKINGGLKMLKVELYYNEANDCIQMVENGVLKYYEEGISGVDYLGYFGENIETIEELKNVSADDIIEGYNCMLSDFKYYSGEDEVRSYFENMKNHNIEGELIYSGISDK
jgi:hypothetical protein